MHLQKRLPAALCSFGRRNFWTGTCCCWTWAPKAHQLILLVLLRGLLLVGVPVCWLATCEARLLKGWYCWMWVHNAHALAGRMSTH